MSTTTTTTPTAASEFRTLELQLLEQYDEMIRQQQQQEEEEQKRRLESMMSMRELESHLMEKYDRIINEEEQKKQEQRQQQLQSIEAAQSLFFVKDDDDDDDDIDEKDKSTEQQQPDNDEQFDEEDLLTVDRLLPKYLNPKRTCSIQSDDLTIRFMEEFRKQQDSNLEAKHWSGFELRVVPIYSIPAEAWKIIITGRPKIIEPFIKAFDKWLDTKIKFHNRDVILARGVSKIVEIQPTQQQQQPQPIGAKLQPVSRQLGGMFMDVSDPHGLLARGLPPEATIPGGTFLCHVNDKVCQTVPKFKRMYEKQTTISEPLRLDLKYLQPPDAGFLADLNAAMQPILEHHGSSCKLSQPPTMTDTVELESSSSSSIQQQEQQQPQNSSTTVSQSSVQQLPAAETQRMVDLQSSTTTAEAKNYEEQLDEQSNTSPLPKDSTNISTEPMERNTISSAREISTEKEEDRVQTLPMAMPEDSVSEIIGGDIDSSDHANKMNASNEASTETIQVDNNIVAQAKALGLGKAVDGTRQQNDLDEQMDISTTSSMDISTSSCNHHHHASEPALPRLKTLLSNKDQRMESGNAAVLADRDSRDASTMDTSCDMGDSNVEIDEHVNDSVSLPPTTPNDPVDDPPRAPSKTNNNVTDQSHDESDDDLFPDEECDSRGSRKENDDDDDDDLFPDEDSLSESEKEKEKDLFPENNDDDDLFPDEDDSEKEDRGDGDFSPDNDVENGSRKGGSRKGKDVELPLPEANSTQGQHDNRDKKNGKKLGAANLAEAHREATLRGQQCYTRFRSKYDELVEEEFCKPTGMHKNRAFGALWEKHKKMFGKDCNESCDCVLAIPDMAETVLDYKTKKPPQKLRTVDKVSGAFPVGIAGNFARTFMPRLKKLYDTEGGSKLLKRLLHMWKLHVKNRNFGMECKDSCECTEGWELVFHKGALPGEDGYQKKKEARAQLRTIPKTHKLPVGLQSRREEQNFDQDRISRYPTKALRKEYEIEFDSTSPLPFYCVTQNLPNGKQCKILSVSPYSKNPVDPRLQANTIILSSNDGTGRKEVNTCHELQTHFEDAIQNGVSLRITFVNKYVTEKSVDRHRKSDQEWTKDGLWRGKCKNGWDGGADCFRREYLKQLKVKDNTAMVVQSDKIKFASGTDSLKQQSDNTNWIATSVQPKGKRIRFASSFETCIYQPDSMPCEVRLSMNCESESSSEVKPPDADGDLPFSSKRQYSYDDLKSLITEGSYRDLQNLYEQGCLTDLHILQVLTKDVKDADALNAKALEQDPNNSDLRKRKQDNNLKRVCLKYYTQVLFVIQEARWLKNWERFRLEITDICDIKLSDKVDSPYDGKIKVEIFLVDTNTRDQYISLPQEPFTSNITYRKDNVVKFNFNSMLTSKRLVELCISFLLPNQSPTVLGAVQISLPELNRDFPADKNVHAVKYQLKPNEFIDDANVRLHFCRETVDEGYVLKRKKNALDKFRNLLTWIDPFEVDVTNFNREFNDDLKPFGANIKVDGHLGLLHAAVFLKDELLVKKLLELGADPTSKSEVGSALALAQNMADGPSLKQRKINAELSKSVLAEDDDDTNAWTTEEPDNDEATINAIIKHLCEYRNQSLHKPAAPDIEAKADTCPMEMTEVACSATPATDQIFPEKETSERLSVDQDECELPVLDQPNWLCHESDPEPCKYWCSKHVCKNCACKYIHVQAPWKEQFQSLRQQAGNDLPWIYNDDFEWRAIVLDRVAHGKKWYTAGIRDFAIGYAFDPLAVVYAEGGSTKVSGQGVSWYHSRTEAMDALKLTCAISKWAYMKGIVPIKVVVRDKTAKLQNLPLNIRCPSWLNIPEVFLCTRWKKLHACKFNSRCHFVHVHGPWGDQLDELYQSIQSPQIDDDNFDSKVQFLTRVENGLILYTAAYNEYVDNPTSPMTRDVMYSEGGPSKVSNSGVSWYKSQEEAKNALQKVFIVSKWAAKNGIKPYRFENSPTNTNKRKGRTVYQDVLHELSANASSKRRRESERVEQVSDFGVEFRQLHRRSSWSHPGDDE